jgi:hypothetical protein
MIESQMDRLVKKLDEIRCCVIDVEEAVLKQGEAQSNSGGVARGQGTANTASTISLCADCVRKHCPIAEVEMCSKYKLVVSECNQFMPERHRTS